MRAVAIVGYSKTGKTTLVEMLAKELSKEGGVVGTVKHAQKGIDTPDRDTSRHLQAGAAATIAVTDTGSVKFTIPNPLLLAQAKPVFKTPEKGEKPPNPALNAALEELADSGVEYALVEGFKESMLPKIVVGEIPEEINPKTILTNLKIKDIEDASTPHRKSQDPPQVETKIAELVELVKRQPDSFHTLKSLILKVKSNPDIKYAGAIGSFTGIVREKTGNTTTLKLEYESHSGLALAKLEEIRRDLKKREGIIEVMLHHKTGVLNPPEDVVYVVIAASHRHQLFPALEEAVERLKAEAPIWKKEHTLDGEYWVTGEHPGQSLRNQLL